jgi:cation diffusion facilitator CzcD-associated flavoprotein CzcO
MAQTKNQSENSADVVIVGAGPYGLSIAAHLASSGVRFRIFGHPMSVWRNHMPRGMRLKSEGFASSLSDARSHFTLRHYCQQQGIEYADVGEPVRLETFIAYGLEFQKRFVPNLEEKLVASLEASPVGYELQLEDGEKVHARSVVIAVGISHYSYLPPVLAGLPKEAVSHSSAHSDLAGFKGRSIAVVGAGASALDLAALLHEAGAAVQLIARSSAIRFQDPPGGKRSFKQRFFNLRTGIGSGIELYFCVNAPHWFRHLPESVRLDRVRKTLGPAPPWFTKEQVDGKVPFHLGVEITSAEVRSGRPTLLLKDAAGKQTTVEADHVIAATGYHVDVEKLQFLSQTIRKRIRTTDKAPTLSTSFESSVPRLYFVGVSSANTFGPMMRFAFGADYTARRISRHLAKPIRSVSKVYAGNESTRAAERV